MHTTTPIEKIQKPRTKLDGTKWLRYSLSVWDDIQKSPEERALKHPAMFPSSLIERLLDCFLWTDGLVLDPFLGSGSTLVAARNKGLSGIGFEIVPKFAKVCTDRLRIGRIAFDEKTTKSYAIKLVEEHNQIKHLNGQQTLYVVQDDVRKIDSYLEKESISILITSPPYWIIHQRARTSDYKEPRPYSELKSDLGNIEKYDDFLDELKSIFYSAFNILKPLSYCIVNVMDLRYGPKFIPFHIDIINKLVDIGYTLEDIIIWNRSKEYNNLRPLGYPHKFIVNKVHEYLIIFRKPL